MPYSPSLIVYMFPSDDISVELDKSRVNMGESFTWITDLVYITYLPLLFYPKPWNKFIGVH